ncbi:MAG: GNAT family N-acetyltransferase [Desulfobacterales bacterium]|nr:GNAT family N-acetyltransferase [Desulfobacterales bacterium]
MPDMLVKLYNLDHNWDFIADQKTAGVTIRKPIGPEKHSFLNWISANFSGGWAAEADVAFTNKPRSCFLAVEASVIAGFACYDATALGYFGPIGVATAYQGMGIGKSLLKACLLDMKLKGYGYAIIGDVKEPEFYQKTVEAIPIPDSTPGIYENPIKSSDPAE